MRKNGNADTILENIAPELKMYCRRDRPMREPSARLPRLTPNETIYKETAMKKVLLATLLCTAIALPALANEPAKAEKMASRLIEKMDRNNDGNISMDEHEAFSAQMFFDVDFNKDRMLSESEITAYKMEEKDEWHTPRNGANYRYQQ